MKGNNNQTAEKLLSSFYVDELMVGTKTEQEAFSFDRKTKDVMASAERYQEMVHIFWAAAEGATSLSNIQKGSAH